VGEKGARRGHYIQDAQRPTAHLERKKKKLVQKVKTGRSGTSLGRNPKRGKKEAS